MKHKQRTVWPSALETWGVAFFALVIIVLGNTQDLLQRYNLISSSRVVHDQLSKGVTHGLRTLDSFAVTQNATTFIVWGLVGLITFSVIQTIWQTSQRVQYEEAVSSNEFIHPQNFNRTTYWQVILTNLVLSIAFLALFFVLAVVYVLFVFPFATHHVGHFLLRPGFSNIPDLLVGLFVGFVSTYALYVAWKLVVWHRRAGQQ